MNLALNMTPELSAVEQALAMCGHTPRHTVELLCTVDETPAAHEPVLELKRRVAVEGIDGGSDVVERALLARAFREFSAPLADAPVCDSVKSLWLSEARRLTQTGSRTPLPAGSAYFTAAAKTATLRRFPSGPLDWETSGLPRSWLLKMKVADALRTVRMLAGEGGIRPYFFTHVALPPHNRALLVEKEVMRSYHRMAKSLELQPSIKGIMTAAWFYQPRALKENPHLAPLNRPFLEWGGLIASLGDPRREATSQRSAGYSGREHEYGVALALWARKSVLAWAREHPEFTA